MIRNYILFLLALLFVCISSIKAADVSVGSHNELVKGIDDLESGAAQTLKHDEQQLMGGDRSIAKSS